MSTTFVETFMHNHKVTLSITFFLFALLPWFFSIIPGNKKRYNLPPSPKRLPIIGNLHQIGWTPHKELLNLKKLLGSSLILLKLGSWRTLIVCSAASVKEIVKSHDIAFSSRPKRALYDTLLYSSSDLGTSPYNEQWRQLKSLVVLQLLSNKRVREFKNIREAEMRLTMEDIEKYSCEGTSFNLTKLLLTLSHNITCKLAFGRKYGEVDDERNVENFKSMLDEFGSLAATLNFGDFIPWLSWLNYINGYNLRAKRLSQRFDSVLDKIIDDHIRKGPSIDGEANKDVVDVLLELQQLHKKTGEGMAISMKTIKGVVMDLFVAGVDTSSTTLSWAMSELIKNPMVMRNAQNQVRSIIGNREHATQDIADKMTYIKAVVKETLRLHPPFPMLFPRETLSDVKLNGYDIPAKTGVFINAWAIARDPDSWERPEEFDPERFLKDDSVGVRDFKGQDFELIPFGFGRRACPGISFSVNLVELALTNLLNKFNWSLPDGQRGEDIDMTENIGESATKKYPLVVVASLAKGTDP